MIKPSISFRVWLKFKLWVTPEMFLRLATAHDFWRSQARKMHRLNESYRGFHARSVSGLDKRVHDQNLIIEQQKKTIAALRVDLEKLHEFKMKYGETFGFVPKL